jgi:hypothetical protein
MSSSDIQALHAEVYRLSSALRTLEDRNEIVDLINSYGLLHDRLLYKYASPSEAERAAQEADAVAWEELFADDVVAAYSKGTRVGKKNLASKQIFS